MHYTATQNIVVPNDRIAQPGDAVDGAAFSDDQLARLVEIGALLPAEGLQPEPVAAQLLDASKSVLDAATESGPDPADYVRSEEFALLPDGDKAAFIAIHDDSFNAEGLTGEDLLAEAQRLFPSG